MPSSSVLFSCWKCFGIILLVLSFFHFFAGTGYKKLIYITSAIISKTFSAMSGNILTIFSISNIKKQEEKKRIQFPMPKNSVANWWNMGTQSWHFFSIKKMDGGREAAVFAEKTEEWARLDLASSLLNCLCYTSECTFSYLTFPVLGDLF